MVQFCCVVGCGNRSNRDNKHFFRIPNVPKKCDKLSFKADIIMNRRKQWLLNINREDLKDGDAAYSPGYIRVCSDHFVSGKPSSWSDVENIDWAPTVRMRYDPNRRRRHRGRVHSNTALRRKIKVQELKRQQNFLKKLSQESDLEHSKTKKRPEVTSGGLTEHPIIHKITVDCIVKQETGDKCEDMQEDEISDQVSLDYFIKLTEDVLKKIRMWNENE